MKKLIQQYVTTGAIISEYQINKLSNNQLSSYLRSRIISKNLSKYELDKLKSIDNKKYDDYLDNKVNDISQLPTSFYEEFDVISYFKDRYYSEVSIIELDRLFSNEQWVSGLSLDFLNRFFKSYIKNYYGKFYQDHESSTDNLINNILKYSSAIVPDSNRGESYFRIEARKKLFMTMISLSSTPHHIIEKLINLKLITMDDIFTSFSGGAKTKLGYILANSKDRYKVIDKLGLSDEQLAAKLTRYDKHMLANIDLKNNYYGGGY